MAKATDAWQEAVSHLFVFAAVLIVGDELKPSDAEADAITRPLIKILMRHYDPARQASNDMLDAFTALVAVSLYVQRIAPDYRARKAEQKVRAFRGSGPKVVPIDRGQQQPTQQPRPAGVAATAAPTGSAGLRTDTLHRGAGPVLPGTPDGRGDDAGAGLTGEAIIESYLGGPIG